MLALGYADGAALGSCDTDGIAEGSLVVGDTDG